MKLTARQQSNLEWLKRNGGKARVHGMYVIAGEEQTNGSAALPFLHLVQKGLVEGKGGELVITEYGQRVLTP